METGQDIIVKLHYLQNPVSFLVLPHIHDEYVQRSWSPGERYVTIKRNLNVSKIYSMKNGFSALIALML